MRPEGFPTPWAALALSPLIAMLLLVPACTQKPKRVVRTEPWPAPLVASAGPVPSTGVPGALVRYRVERANVRVELPARRAKPRATLAELSGSIDLDPVHLEKTRAHLEADLLSLSFEGSDGQADPALLARAQTWLELTPDRDADARRAERYAVLDITAIEANEPRTDRIETGRASVVMAHGELTLHRFRVPVTLELEVKLEQGDAGAANTLSIRTRRPLVVSLAAHDILPRDARGNVLVNELSGVGRDVGREARISVELTARIEGR